MKIVQSEDLKLKRSSMNFLQNLATLPLQILETDGQWPKVHKVLKGLFPVTGKSWLYTNVRKQDWTVLQNETLNATSGDVNGAVPKFKLLPANYRYKLDFLFYFKK